jgi:hypothetical protein
MITFLFYHRLIPIINFCSDPMRITKKFAGSNGIGKQVFSPCTSSDKSNDAKKKLFTEITHLERIFLNKVQSNHNVSFPISAKALAFSAKLQLQVQQAPLMTHMYGAGGKFPSNGGYKVISSKTNAPSWTSRFDASNTNSITINQTLSTEINHQNLSGDESSTSNDFRSGDKRPSSSSSSTQQAANVNIQHSQQQAIESRKRKSMSADADASSLLVNFFKSTRDKDCSDMDSDSNESSNDNNSGESSNTGGQLADYDNDDSGGNNTGSSSDDNTDAKKKSKSSTLLPF